MDFSKIFNARDCISQCVKIDFDCLIKKFKECDSLEFPAFTSIWREMKMSMISTGKMTEREARQFAEELLSIIVTYLHEQSDFETKTGAFYLMYSFYSTQPVLPKSQIRLTIKDWATLNRFIEEAILKKLHDVEFIFHKLCATKAFLYVAPPNELSQGQYGTDPSDDDDIYMGQLFSEKKSPLENIFNKDNIEHLSAIHNKYQEMKCILSGVELSSPDSSVNMLDVNTATVIDNLVQSFVKESQPNKKQADLKKEVHESDSPKKKTSLNSGTEKNNSGSENEDNYDISYQVDHESMIEDDEEEEEEEEDDDDDEDESDN